MLSRVADSLYWINRYVERAENISRFVEVSEAMALDCPPGSAEPWLPLIDASGDRELFDQLHPAGTPDDVIYFLVCNNENPSSVHHCLCHARENARQIREVITTEMWEQMKGTYWTLQEEDFSLHPPRNDSAISARPANSSMASPTPHLAATCPGNSVVWGVFWSGRIKPSASSM